MNSVIMWILIILGIVVIGYLLLQFLMVAMVVVIIAASWIKVWKEFKKKWAD